MSIIGTGAVSDTSGSPLDVSFGESDCDYVDSCEVDFDYDGVCDDVDVCIGMDNENDFDGDGICDDVDPCEGLENFVLDCFYDEVIDELYCEFDYQDSDGDGICNDIDVCNGEYDDCGDCNGGNAAQDCAGVCDGDAMLDECGVCEGGNYCEDGDVNSAVGNWMFELHYDFECSGIDTYLMDAELYEDGSWYSEALGTYYGSQEWAADGNQLSLTATSSYYYYGWDYTSTLYFSGTMTDEGTITDGIWGQDYSYYDYDYGYDIGCMTGEKIMNDVSFTSDPSKLFETLAANMPKDKKFEMPKNIEAKTITMVPSENNTRTRCEFVVGPDADCSGECFGDAVEDCAGDCDGDAYICDALGECVDYEEDCTLLGDVNFDTVLDVLDVISIVNAIVSQVEIENSDINEDGSTDVIDVVALVAIILDGGARAMDADSATMTIANNSLRLSANGYIGGVQMTLLHSNGFELNLTDNAMVSEYKTTGTSTMLVVVVPEEELIFTANQSFEVVDMIVANSEVEIDVNTVSEFGLTAAYPNPFNPSTTVSLNVPSADFVSVKVYNLVGQVVGVLAEGMMDANSYTFTWNATDMSSGVYMIRAESGSKVDIQKVLLVK